MSVALSWIDPQQTILLIEYSGIVTREDLEAMVHEKRQMQQGKPSPHYAITDLSRTIAAKDLNQVITFCQNYNRADTRETAHLIVIPTGLVATLTKSILAIVSRMRPDLTYDIQLVESRQAALDRITSYKQISVS